MFLKILNNPFSKLSQYCPWLHAQYLAIYFVIDGYLWRLPAEVEVDGLEASEMSTQDLENLLRGLEVSSRRS